MTKKDLSSLIKAAQQKKINPKIQEVKPIKKSKLENEKMFSLYLPEDILLKLKILSAERNSSIKNLITIAIKEKYINKI